MMIIFQITCKNWVPPHPTPPPPPGGGVSGNSKKKLTLSLQIRQSGYAQYVTFPSFNQQGQTYLSLSKCYDLHTFPCLSPTFNSLANWCQESSYVCTYVPPFLNVFWERQEECKSINFSGPWWLTQTSSLKWLMYQTCSTVWHKKRRNHRFGLAKSNLHMSIAILGYVTMSLQLKLCSAHKA